MPAAVSISVSASTNGSASRAASRRPTVDLARAHQPDQHDRLAGPQRGAWARTGGGLLQHGVRGYTARRPLGQKARAQESSEFSKGASCPVSLVILVVLLVVVVGGLFLLAGPRPANSRTTRVEKAVPLENLS